MPRTARLAAFAVLTLTTPLHAQLPKAIAPGTTHYHLVEETHISNSMIPGGGSDVRRDLYFVMTLVANMNALHAALTLDSVIVTTAQRGRVALPAFAKASWRGTLSASGAGPIGQFMLADGSATSSPLVTPLRWALPVLPGTSDVLEITTVAQSGATRTLRAERAFTGADNTVTLAGNVRLTSSGELHVNEAVVAKKPRGTLGGSWRMSRDGAVLGATITYAMADTTKLGGEEMTTGERTTLTLTRLP